MEIATKTSFASARHPWGQLVYPRLGVLELSIRGASYAAPPGYALWVPPQTDHLALAITDTAYTLLDIDDELCGDLLSQPAAISVSKIGKAIISDFELRSLTVPESPQDRRLMEVLLDQLASASPIHSGFLPLSRDRHLKLVLKSLLQDPGDRRSLSDWARVVNSTERTLARRCRRDLGMSFAQWSRQLRLTHAITLLSEGKSVQQVSAHLGYRTSSAFISMFSAETGFTPSAYRTKMAALA